MTELLHIRSATKEDVPLILQMIKDLAVYEKLSAEVVATEANLTQTLFGERAYAEVLLAYAQDKPVGFALFFHNYSTFLAKPGIYLEDLYVKDEARGQGFGKQLLLHLVALAKQRGCGRVEWSVLDWNKSAIDFYDSLGAQAMSEWIGYRLAGDALELL